MSNFQRLLRRWSSLLLYGVRCFHLWSQQLYRQFADLLFDIQIKQSGISLNLRTGPTGHATLFNQWEGALVFINKQIKTSPQWSKIFKTTDRVGQNQSSFQGFQAYFNDFSWGIHNFFLSGQRIGSHIRSVSWNIQHILWLISSARCVGEILVGFQGTMENKRTWDCLKKPLQAIIPWDSAPKDIFFVRLWVHPVAPPPPSHPPSPSAMLWPKSTHLHPFCFKIKFVWSGRGRVASFINITGKVPTLLTSIVACEQSFSFPGSPKILLAG